MTVLVLMLGLCLLVTICLRGTSPPQHAGILLALSEVLRNLWPW